MKIIYFLSFFLISNFSFSMDKDKLEIDGKYTVDWNSTYTLSTLKTKTFHPLINNKISIGYNNHASIWCVFKIQNTDLKNSVKTWLCFENNHIDSLFFYDGKKIQLLGDRTNFVSPFMKGQCFSIALKPNENKTIQVKLKKEISFFEFSYSFDNEKTLSISSSRKTSFITLFLGSILFLLIFNFILYFITKSKLILKYILYSILTILYITIISNYLKNNLFNEFIYFSELQIYTACFWFISLSYFMMDFLELKKNQPQKHKIIYYCNLLIIVSILSSLVVLYTNLLNLLQFFFYITYSAFLILFSTITLASIANYKINKKNSLYVLFAFIPHFLWGNYFVLKSFSIIKADFHEDWVIYIGLYEVLFFGYVLTKNYIETFRKNNALNLEILAEKEKSIRLISHVQIRERRNIANIIHDNLGSKIAYVLQLLQLKNIAHANTTIQELANDIREISHQILPKSLDEGALLDSLKSQIYILNKGLQDVKIELFTYDFPENINEIWIYDIYLICLEIINNAIKHGESNHITIEFYGYSKNYRFQFTDDGVGFNSQGTPKGFGLENIEKRIHNYNGIFEINSVKNEGTIIQLSIPKKK
ncbi:sensor histidine kinase [Flavobacterium myungsuense]|uniref:histidine kinase n=1 Tax=Flavobacterium myungsuense TaxID=651823 RepID=A0ABW3J492_9FLAO